MPNYKIYCDQDGVLSFFEEQVKKLTGKYPDQIRDEKGPKAFKEIVNKLGEPLWADMQWMPNGKKLWNHIKHFNPIILTAPMSTNGCHSGKKKWITRELGPNVKIIIDAQKFKYATDNSILIDDRAKNIQSWETAGGIGILHDDNNIEATINKLTKITNSVRESVLKEQSTVIAYWLDPEGNIINIGTYSHDEYVIKHPNTFGFNFVMFKHVKNNPEKAIAFALKLGAIKAYKILTEDNIYNGVIMGYLDTLRKNLFQLVLKNLMRDCKKVSIIIPDKGTFNDIPIDELKEFFVSKLGPIK